MSPDFAFDLDDIEQVAARARAFGELVIEQLDVLDGRIRELIESGAWTGAAATAYAEQHRAWTVAARAVADGAATMAQAASIAHERYSAAMETNRRMTGG